MALLHRILVVGLGVVCLNGHAMATGPYAAPPMLDAAVASGSLPPVQERLPREPAIIDTGGDSTRTGARLCPTWRGIGS